MSSSDHHSHTQRPGFPKNGSTSWSQKQKQINLSELGLLPRKDGQRPVTRRSKHDTSASNYPQLQFASLCLRLFLEHGSIVHRGLH